MIRYKESVVGTIDEYYQTAKEHDDVKKIVETTKDKKIRKEYEYYNDIIYRGYRINIVELAESAKDDKKLHFAFATNIKVTDSNCKKLMEHGWRRWKI